MVTRALVVEELACPGDDSVYVPSSPRAPANWSTLRGDAEGARSLPSPSQVPKLSSDPNPLTGRYGGVETRIMEEREEGELRAVGEVVDRLATKYPGVDRSVIENIVAEEHQTYEGRPVRDFVPVLVEKSAKKRVKKLARADVLESSGPPGDGGDVT